MRKPKWLKVIEALREVESADMKRDFGLTWLPTYRILRRAFEAGLITSYIDGTIRFPDGHETKLEDGRHGRLRPCIRCGKPFLSSGAGHRMCDLCRQTAKSIYNPSYEVRL